MMPSQCRGKSWFAKCVLPNYRLTLLFAASPSIRCFLIRGPSPLNAILIQSSTRTLLKHQLNCKTRRSRLSIVPMPSLFCFKSKAGAQQIDRWQRRSTSQLFLQLNASILKSGKYVDLVGFKTKKIYCHRNRN